jgi:lysophospholipase L1-like esterase
MEFRTIVDIPKPGFEIQPCEELLFVGSCFADNIGQRFRDEGFPVVVNPFGTMYNPASVLHTLQRIDWCEVQPRTVFLTLGTNHVYRLKETGEIVDNCQKRPAALFQEEKLSVDQCTDYLRQSIALLRQLNPDIRIVLTVSPIRYRKYGYHESQLSKATLLLTASSVCDDSIATYFPAYEIINDELRDYRFYAADMLHPSEQAVDYIWERLVETYFSAEAKAYLAEWLPLRQALNHKPFAPNSDEYHRFRQQTLERLAAFQAKYPAARLV